MRFPLQQQVQEHPEEQEPGRRSGISPALPCRGAESSSPVTVRSKEMKRWKEKVLIAALALAASPLLTTPQSTTPGQANRSNPQTSSQSQDRVQRQENPQKRNSPRRQRRKQRRRQLRQRRAHTRKKHPRPASSVRQGTPAEHGTRI